MTKPAGGLAKRRFCSAVLLILLLSPLIVTGTSTNPTITVVKVGQNPGGLLYNPSDKQVYMTLDPSTVVMGPKGFLEPVPGNVVVMQDTRVVANLTVGPAPSDLIYDSANAEMYVGVLAHPEDPGSIASVIRVLSGASFVANITDVTGYPLLFDPFNNYLYVLDRSFNDNLTVVSGTTVIGRINVGPAGVGEPIVCDPVNGYVYIPRSGPPYGITVVSGTQIVGTLGTASFVDGALVNPTNGNVYFHVTGSNTVSVASGANLIANLTVEPPDLSFGLLLYDPGNNRVYATDSGANMVTVISGTSIVANLTVGPDPVNMTYDPANGYIFVENYGSNATVSVISGSNVIASIPIPSDIVGFKYNPSDGNLYGFVPYNLTAGTFTVISATGVVGYFADVKWPVSWVFDPSNNDTYIANRYSDYVSVLSTSGTAGGASGGSAGTASLVSFTVLVFALVAAVIFTLVVITFRRWFRRSASQGLKGYTSICILV